MQTTFWDIRETVTSFGTSTVDTVIIVVRLKINRSPGIKWNVNKTETVWRRWARHETAMEWGSRGWIMQRCIWQTSIGMGVQTVDIVVVAVHLNCIGCRILTLIWHLWDSNLKSSYYFTLLFQSFRCESHKCRVIVSLTRRLQNDRQSN